MNHQSGDGSTAANGWMVMVWLSPNAAGLTRLRKDRFCGMVDELRLGDRVRFRGSEFVVRGLSPRSVVPGRVILVNPATGERILVAVDEIQGPAAVAQPSDPSEKNR